MYFVSSGLRPSSVFTTQANESSTEPTAMVLINALGMRRPKSPFARNPSSGKIGISQRFIWVSVLHRLHFVDHQRRAILEHRENNGQPHGRFSGGHPHHEETEDVPIP